MLGWFRDDLEGYILSVILEDRFLAVGIPVIIPLFQSQMGTGDELHHLIRGGADHGISKFVVTCLKGGPRDSVGGGHDHLEAAHNIGLHDDLEGEVVHFGYTGHFVELGLQRPVDALLNVPDHIVGGDFIAGGVYQVILDFYSPGDAVLGHLPGFGRLFNALPVIEDTHAVIDSAHKIRILAVVALERRECGPQAGDTDGQVLLDAVNDVLASRLSVGARPVAAAGCQRKGRNSGKCKG